jgi:hypothetical protein
MKKNNIIILSSLFLFYFILLIYNSYNNVVLNIFISVLFELITIPIIILEIIMYISSIKKWTLENFPIKSTYFFSIIIITFTLLLLIISTKYKI